LKGDPNPMYYFRLVRRDSTPASRSPFRLVDGEGREVAWVNDFLDTQRLRGLALCSLRIYAYDLLHFTRWWCQLSCRSLSELHAELLADYVRFQLDSHPQPTPQTINHRLTALRCLYRFHYGHDIPGEQARLGHTYRRRCPDGSHQRPARVTAGLRLRQPSRVVIPLSTEEVSRFWRSFRSFRDLGIMALMLFDGLRSREILTLQLEDAQIGDAQLRVHGKGIKERFLPLPEETLLVLRHYLYSERPLVDSATLFVSLKGPKRGQPMSPAGLRSLFRHHRRRTNLLKANPHRFRHTFGAEMVRAGVSLPALMHLMGHSQIHTTMRYVRLAPEDVWCEFARAVELRNRQEPSPKP